MAKSKPGEKVTLEFMGGIHKRYIISHLNKPGLKISRTSEKISVDLFIADYWCVRDLPSGNLSGKRYSVIDKTKDVLVVRKGYSIEEKLYNLALEEAKNYAEERGLKFEDRSNFIPDPFP